MMAYLNGNIPSQQRATVLSFNSLLSSIGGSVNQPALGRVADVYSYSTAYIVSGALSLISLPLYYLTQRENSDADKID